MKLTRHRAMLVVLLTIALSACGPRGLKPPQVALELIAEGFTSPVQLVDPDDGSQRLFVADQTGEIWIIADGRRTAEPFLDLRTKIAALNSLYDERGLLGLALHPDFASNGRLYLSYSGRLREGLSSDEWDHTTYISEFMVSSSAPDRPDPGTERVLLAMDKPGYNYEAGHIAFGPDGYLYVATGDSVRDPAIEAGEFAQDTFSMLGKILRIDVDGLGEEGQPYAIPPDNPFASGGGRPEVYAYGFRNPYRFSFEQSEASASPRLFVGDVGQAALEEVDLVEAGGNYGWPVREGTQCFDPQDWNQPPNTCQSRGLLGPILAYAHSGDLSAVIGGVVYRGESLPALYGGYVFGDWGRGHGHLFVAWPPALNSGRWNPQEIHVQPFGNADGFGQLLGIGVDHQGELYLLTKAPGYGPTGDTGRIYRVAPPS